MEQLTRHDWALPGATTSSRCSFWSLQQLNRLKLKATQMQNQVFIEIYMCACLCCFCENKQDELACFYRTLVKQEGKEQRRAALHAAGQSEPGDDLPHTAHGAEMEQSPLSKKRALEDLLGHSFTEEVDSAQPNNGIETEMDLYLKETCPFQWWRDNVRFYPLLSPMTKAYLSVPATSTPSERVIFYSKGHCKRPKIPASTWKYGHAPIPKKTCLMSLSEWNKVKLVYFIPGSDYFKSLLLFDMRCSGIFFFILWEISYRGPFIVVLSFFGIVTSLIVCSVYHEYVDWRRALRY